MFRNWLIANRDVVLHNFPFLEDDFDALTDYEFFCKLMGYVFNFAKDNEEFKKQLEKYENYFNNLDVQEEIDKKLDEMADSGQLDEIIAVYLEMKSLLIYDTVADMKLATNIINGSTAKTLGYYNVNDNGGACYRIRTKTLEDTIDEAFLIALADETLVAELLINDEINIKQLGVTGVETDDYSDLINEACQKEYNVYFPNGTYTLSKQLLITNASNKVIRGDGVGSVFKISDNQVGDHTSYMSTSYLENPANLTFKDFKIDAGTQTIRRYILTAYTCDGLFLNNLELCYGCGYATRFNDSKNIVADNLYIHDCTGVAASSVGGGFYGMNMENVQVTNSRFENIGDHAFYLTGDIASTGTTSAKNMQLSNIYIKNCGSDDLTAGGAITIYGDIENVEVNNCIMKECRQGIHISNHGEGVITPRKITISNCVMTDNGSAGIFIGGLEDDLIDDVTINNCVIDGATSDGFSIRQADNVCATNNIIKNCVRLGIELVNTNNSTFTNNLLKDNLQQFYVGTRDSTHAEGNVIVNNYIYVTDAYKTENETSRGLYVHAVSTNCYVANNYIKNHPYFNITVNGATNTVIMQDNNTLTSIMQKNITYGTSAPTSYYNKVGDICFNSNATAGGNIGWVCVTAGNSDTSTDGVWKTFGSIAE